MKQLKEEFGNLLVNLSPKHDVWWCGGNPEDYEDGNDHWNIFNNADFTEELWSWFEQKLQKDRKKTLKGFGRYLVKQSTAILVPDMVYWIEEYLSQQEKEDGE